MTSLPLHPAIVHLPLGLAFVIPPLAIAFGWLLWRGRITRRSWMTIVALQGVLLVTGVAAMNTGEREEDRVARFVPDAALEQHEERAEQFVWAAGVTLLLSALVLAFRTPVIVRGLSLAAIAGTIVVAASGIRVGHAGGRLVYVHNAGAAYSAPTQRSQAALTTGVERRRTRDEHDRGSGGRERR